MSKIRTAISRIAEYYPRCLKLVWQASRKYAILAFTFSILSAVVPAAQVWLSKVVIDTVVDTLNNPTGVATADWFELLAPIGVVFLVWVVGGICQSASSSLSAPTTAEL